MVGTNFTTILHEIGHSITEKRPSYNNAIEREKLANIAAASLLRISGANEKEIRFFKSDVLEGFKNYKLNAIAQTLRPHLPTSEFERLSELSKNNSSKRKLNARTKEGRLENFKFNTNFVREIITHVGKDKTKQLLSEPEISKKLKLNYSEGFIPNYVIRP